MIADKTDRRGKTRAGGGDQFAGATPYSIRIAEWVNQRKLAAQRISELTKQATAALEHPLGSDAGARPASDDALITTRQVADLLKIDVGMVGLWNTMGILKQVPSPEGDLRFRREDILTFSARLRGTARGRGLSDTAKGEAGPN